MRNPQSPISNPQSLWALVVAALLILLGCATPPPSHPSRVDLSGTRNFRDVGGYATLEGKHVKTGVLYRSDDLADLSPIGLETFAALGVKRVYDLRGEGERESNPNRLPEGSSIELVEIPMYFPAMDPALMQHRILTGKVKQGDFHQLMMDAYRHFALEERPQLATILRDLSEPDGLPALIQCTHGKDRTGIAVALTLRAVGVPQETVVQDYMLSNKFWESEASRLSCFASCASFFQTPRSEVRALLEVRPEYLEAAFEAIDEHYGSFENYLDQGLRVDEPTLQMLQSTLLE